MKIFNRYSNQWNSSQRKILLEYNILVEDGFSSFDIEDNEDTKKIIEIIENWGATKYYWTDYESEDFKNSPQFIYIISWKNGYPMPDNNEDFLKITYNLNDYCEQCGIGKVQNSSFRIASSPIWGKRLLFELNWIHDEIFVHKKVYNSVFKKYGIEAREVILFKKEIIIEDTLQLIIPTTEISLQLENQEFQTCQKCMRKKYNPNVRGYLPRLSKQEFALEKTKEFFGSGHEAHNLIYFSRQIWNELNSLKLKFNAWPVSFK